MPLVEGIWSAPRGRIGLIARVGGRGSCLPVMEGQARDEDDTVIALSPHRAARWLPFQRLDVYQVARELVPLVHEAKITDAELRDQATRAAKRTFLGLWEGLPVEGQGLRRKYFNEANASLHETLGEMDLSATIGAARQDDALAIQRLGVRVKRMLRALLH